MLTREELQQEVRNLLAEAALVPTFGEVAVSMFLTHLLSMVFSDAEEEGLRAVSFHEVKQTDQRFVLHLMPSLGADGFLDEDGLDEFCAAVEGLIDVEGVTVEPYESKEAMASSFLNPDMLFGGAVGAGKPAAYFDAIMACGPLWSTRGSKGNRYKLAPPAAHGPARKGKAGKPARW